MTWVAALGAALVWGGAYAVAAEPAAGLNAQPLAEVARRSADEFRPVLPSDLDAARLQLAENAVALERVLSPGSPRGEAWKVFLEWRGVQRQLPAGAEPNLRALQTTLDLLNSGQPGLERPEFRAAAGSVERLLDLGL
ncbi:MAG: hypothetical protein AAF790_13705, partial [Planctomycetota bacterium]